MEREGGRAREERVIERGGRREERGTERNRDRIRE